MSKKSRLASERRKRALITVRYLFPLLLLAAVLLSAFIPCLRFISIETGSLGTESLISWLGERWSTVRSNLLEEGSEVSSAEGVAFVQTEFVLLIAFCICFLLGAAMICYMTVKVFDILREPQRFDTSRALFMTLVPNSWVHLLYQLLLFPVLFLPRIWLKLAQEKLMYNITLHLSFAEPWMIALALFAAEAVLCVISLRAEHGAERNPFLKHRIEAVTEEAPQAEEPVAETDAALRRESADYIRRLLAEEPAEEEDTAEETGHRTFEE